MAAPPNYSVELPQIERPDSSPESTMVFVEPGHPAMPYYQASYPNRDICGWLPSSPSPLSFSNCWSLWPPFFGFVPTPAFTPHGSFYPSATMPSPLAVLESIPSFDCGSPTDGFGEANLQPEIDHFEVPQLSTSFAGSCCAIDSLLVPDEKVGGSAAGNLRRSEPEVKLMRSSSSPMELISLTEDVPREAAPRKWSRIAHACERCRIRKARCFGGNPCHRCDKRKFVCEFSPSRERGFNKSRSFNLPTASQAVDGHGHHTKLKIRRQSAHSVTSGRKPPVTILKPLPKHTAIPFLRFSEDGAPYRPPPPVEVDGERERPGRHSSDLCAAPYFELDAG